MIKLSRQAIDNFEKWCVTGVEAPDKPSINLDELVREIRRTGSREEEATPKVFQSGLETLKSGAHTGSDGFVIRITIWSSGDPPPAWQAKGMPKRGK